MSDLKTLICVAPCFETQCKQSWLESGIGSFVLTYVLDFKLQFDCPYITDNICLFPRSTGHGFPAQ